MTPEERAKSADVLNKIVAASKLPYLETSGEIEDMKLVIALAIREAVNEEREACAQIARKYYHSAMFCNDPRRDDECEVIANAIHDRSREGKE